MNEVETKVALAKQGLAVAQQVLDAALRDQRQHKLCAAIETGRTLNARKEKSERVFDAAQIEFDQFVSSLTNKNHAVSVHCSKKPLVENFSSATEVKEWQTELDRLVAERDALAQKARDADARLGDARMEFLSACGAVDNIRQLIANLRDVEAPDQGMGFSNMSANNQMPQTTIESVTEQHRTNRIEVKRIVNVVGETGTKVVTSRAERAADFNPGTDAAVLGHESDLVRFKSALAQRRKVGAELRKLLAGMGVTVESDPDDNDDADRPDANGNELGRGTWSSVRVQDSVRSLGRFRIRDKPMPLPD